MKKYFIIGLFLVSISCLFAVTLEEALENAWQQIVAEFPDARQFYTHYGISTETYRFSSYLYDILKNLERKREKDDSKVKKDKRYIVTGSLKGKYLTVEVYLEGSDTYKDEPLFVFTEKVEFTEAWQIADTYFETYFSYGDFHLGYTTDTQSAFDLNVSAFNFFVKNKTTNLWFKFSPFNYWYSTPSSSEYLISFINTSVYWNVLEHLNNWRSAGKYDLGPYLSLSCLMTDNTRLVNVNDAIFGAGMKFSYGWRTYSDFGGDNSHITIFDLDVGYRNKLGVHQFYIGIQLLSPDFLNALVGFFMGA